MKTTLVLIYFILSTMIAKSQTATMASGGVGTGSGGMFTYIVGQVYYTTITGSNGSAVQGIQHVYLMNAVSGLNEHQISLEMKAYPNPTPGDLTLTIGDLELSSLQFQLYDSMGKLIERKKITSRSETIRMENLASATYFLKIINNTEEVKTFKIIKK
jgi:hypothetical protein